MQKRVFIIVAALALAAGMAVLRVWRRRSRKDVVGIERPEAEIHAEAWPAGWKGIPGEEQ